MKDVLLVVLGAVLGWFSQWLFYRYQQRDERDQGPLIVVAKVKRLDQLFLDIRNVGPDALSDMTVEVRWLSGASLQRKTLSEFYSPDHDAADPIHPELLESEGRLEARGIPDATDDGIIDVQVSGVGVKSHKVYSLVSQIDVALRKA